MGYKEVSRVDNYTLFARIALSFAFLSAVADRFGFWTPLLGSDSVAWGNMDSFTTYTGSLIPYVPQKIVPLFAWAATIAEIVLGISLLVGFQKRLTYLASGVLLLIFAFSMMIFVNAKAPFDYSVLTAAACSFLLYRDSRK